MSTSEHSLLGATRTRAKQGRTLHRGTILSLALALVAGPVATGCESEATPTRSKARLRVDVQRYRVPVVDDEITLGGDQALVTIVLFSDYACSPCRALWHTMRRLHEDYGDDLRIVYRGISVPGFEEGQKAAEFALAAHAQGKFWPMHWRVFEHQQDLSMPALVAHGEAIGLDMEQLGRDVDEGVHVATRLRHARQAKALGVIAAPIAFVNGAAMVGPSPDEQMWHDLIDGEIATARALLASGTKRAELYTAIQKGALEEAMPVPEEVRKLRESKAKEAASGDGEVARTFDYSKVVKPDPNKRYDLPIEGDPFIGPADAPIVLIEFTDYQCPFCRRAHEQLLAPLRDAFPEQLKIVIKDNPLEMHPYARVAAKAALAADRQGRFAGYHDRLLESDAAFGVKMFRDLAGSLALDVPAWQKAFEDPQLEAELDADRLIAYELGITGTPAFFLNGVFYDGLREFAFMKTAIERELEALAAHEAAGNPASSFYRAQLAAAVTRADFPNVVNAKAASAPEPSP